VEETSAAAESTADAGFTTVTEGVLTMATNAYFPPYEYYEGDAIVGIDADIANAIAEKLGLTLVITDMEFDSIITAVSTGKADMGLAGMTVTEDRLKNINFSDTYATGVQSVIVQEGGDIASLDDLAGKKIGVQLGTTGDIYATDDFGEDYVEQFNKGNDAVMALTTGKVDAVIIDNEPAKSYVAANEGLTILDTEYAVEDYAACIAKENTALLDAVNGALQELQADGTLQSIIDKYISAD
jgi:polar amino acid transport system substrate-binding protein